jgi:hypothetical protein
MAAGMLPQLRSGLENLEHPSDTAALSPVPPRLRSSQSTLYLPMACRRWCGLLVQPDVTRGRPRPPLVRPCCRGGRESPKQTDVLTIDVFICEQY